MVTGVLKGNKVYKYNDEDYEVIERHREWQEAIHYGDPTGDNENQTSKTSVIKQLREYGIYVNTNRKKFGIKDRIETTKLLIRRLKVDKDLTIFIDAIENARYPKRKDGSQATTGNEKPIHDWTSHPRTALEFFAVNEEMKGGMAKMVTSAMKKISQDIEKRLDRKYNQKYNKDNNRPKYKTCA
jgi:predicted transcriptional regulator YheO